VEATAFHFIADRLGERPLTIATHILFGIVGLWLLVRLAEPVRGWVVFSPRAITDLSAIAQVLRQVNTQWWWVRANAKSANQNKSLGSQFNSPLFFIQGCLLLQRND